MQCDMYAPHVEHRIKGSHLNYYERFIENNTAHGRTALIVPHNPKERYTQKTSEYAPLFA